MEPSSDPQSGSDKAPSPTDVTVTTVSTVSVSDAVISSTSVNDVLPVGGAKAIEKLKGKRTTLSLHEKFIVKTFCDQQISESKARADFVPSHDALRQEIATKFGWEVGRSTLSKIMSMDWQQLQVHAHPNPNMKRKRKPLFPAFEDDLVKSMRAHLARQESVSPMLPAEAMDTSGGRNGPFLTEAFIMEEAQRLKQQHGIKDEELVLSVGWLARFKHRHGIRLRKGTASTVDNGEAAGVGSMPASIVLQMADMSSKRLKKISTGQPSRWPTSFQFPSAYSGMDIGDTRVIDQPLSVLPFINDLRTTCIYHATVDGDTSDPVELVPSAIFEGVPMEVLQFACPHCPVSLPFGIGGLHVVVIGFNCVRDAFLTTALVGAHGSVTCIETNPLAFAATTDHVDTYAIDTLGYNAPNLQLVSVANLDHGIFADLVARKNMVCFNCSFQQAAHKAQLLGVAFNLLQEGGECRLSYVSSSRRLSSTPQLERASIITDDLISASIYTEDFRRMCQHVGFLDPRCFRVQNLESFGHDSNELNSPDTVGITTARLFKLGLVEDRPEDYGEHATYKGTVSTLVYRLDAQFTFMRDVTVAIDGNTAQILRLSWLKHMFNVEGDRLTHRGRFNF